MTSYVMGTDTNIWIIIQFRNYGFLCKGEAMASYHDLYKISFYQWVARFQHQSCTTSPHPPRSGLYIQLIFFWVYKCQPETTCTLHRQVEMQHICFEVILETIFSSDLHNTLQPYEVQPSNCSVSLQHQFSFSC